jgi:hypothetical protein
VNQPVASTLRRFAQRNVRAGHVTRHAIGSDLEVRMWTGRDELGCYVELRLFRRSVSELSRDAEVFQPTDAGPRAPAHRAALIGAQLQGLGEWADELAKREAKR